MMARWRCIVRAVAVVWLGFSPLGAAPAEEIGPVLGIDAEGRFFTLDGRPTFLLGVSYYGALGIESPALAARDLDDTVAAGFNWIRVWVFWEFEGMSFSALTRTGEPREPYLARLKDLIVECSKRRMILDCTLHRGESGDCTPANQAQHLACVRRIARELLPYRNVYIDVANERDVRDDRHVTLEEMGELIGAIKEIDPRRLATGSGVPGSAEELAAYRKVGRCDCLAPHLCREKGCAAKTEGTLRRYEAWMRAAGVRFPVHLQEPFRRGFAAYEPTVEDFLQDALGARAGGAAGWCLHNGSVRTRAEPRPFRSFLMNAKEGRLFDQWDAVEKAVISRLSRELGDLEIHGSPEKAGKGEDAPEAGAEAESPAGR